MTETFTKSITVPVDVATLFAWHERPGALLRLSPPWDPPRIVRQDGGIRDGARVVLEVNAGPVPTTWEVEHRDYIPNVQFRDVMLSGPFESYVHTHSFAAAGDGASTLTDTIEYALPLGAVGSAVGGWYARETLERIFAYRHALMAGDLARHAQFASHPRMRIGITGASGFIGSQLSAFLTTGGHTVVRIGRGDVVPGRVDVSWDPVRGKLDARALEGLDAIVHLAGANIGERWSREQKRAIRDSRVEGTSLLAHAITQLSRKPRVLVCASAVGYYGSRGDELLDERSRPGNDWLAQVTVAWERAAEPAQHAGVRVVHLRKGFVQGAAGGALARLLPVFRVGAGGKLGSGTQWVSPIAFDDVIGAYHFGLMRDDIRGPVNVVAPEAVTNAQYTEVLASVLGRPAIAPAPAFALKLAFGEMAEATVLASQRVMPTALANAGFAYRHPTLEGMLRFELGVH